MDKNGFHFSRKRFSGQAQLINLLVFFVFVTALPCPYTVMPDYRQTHCLAPIMNARVGIAQTNQTSIDYDLAPDVADAIAQLKEQKFEMVVPVFNKADDIEKVVAQLKANGLLQVCTFVEDVSTDGTKEILERMIRDGTIAKEQVIFRTVNGKKVRGINEYLNQNPDRKDAYTMVMDADSVIESSTDASPARAMLEMINYCKYKNLDAVTVPFLINTKPTLNPAVLLQKGMLAFSNYMRHLNQMFNQFPFLHGACTVWKTSALLDVYKNPNHKMDFKTEDVDSTRIAKKSRFRAVFTQMFFSIKTNPEPIDVYIQQQSRWTASVFANLTTKQKLILATSFLVSIGIPILTMPFISDPVIFCTITGVSLMQMLLVMSRMDISKQLASDDNKESIYIDNLNLDDSLIRTAA